MGGINTLIRIARFAGLRLRLDGELLRITGPRKATAVAKELLDCKREVVEFLAQEAAEALNEFGENIEMHDSALFDEPVEVTFYDGQRLLIPQKSTPEDWIPQF